MILGRGSCSELGRTQLAGAEKATPGLRGLSGPAGGADFLGFAMAKIAIPNDFVGTISLDLGELPSLETLELLSYLP